MTREEAIEEVNKVFEPAFANYIITALTEGATVSDIQHRWGRAYEAGVKDGLEQEPCEDAVSRTEVLNLVRFNAFHVKSQIKAIENMPSVTPQEPNWIKCSEHLPDFDVDVLATTKKYGDVVKVTRWRTILKDCGWEWVLVDNIEGNAYNSDEIIAWIPLPQPYKEVE